eukprot:Awhi_evm1s11687
MGVLFAVLLMLSFSIFEIGLALEHFDGKIVVADHDKDKTQRELPHLPKVIHLQPNTEYSFILQQQEEENEKNDKNMVKVVLDVKKYPEFHTRRGYLLIPNAIDDVTCKTNAILSKKTITTWSEVNNIVSFTLFFSEKHVTSTTTYGLCRDDSSSEKEIINKEERHGSNYILQDALSYDSVANVRLTIVVPTPTNLNSASFLIRKNDTISIAGQFHSKPLTICIGTVLAGVFILGLIVPLVVYVSRDDNGGY